MNTTSRMASAWKSSASFLICAMVTGWGVSGFDMSAGKVHKTRRRKQAKRQGTLEETLPLA